MRNDLNTFGTIVTILLCCLVLFLLASMAIADIRSLFWVAGLTGFVFIYNRINDKYFSAPVKPWKSFQQNPSSNSNGAFGTVKTVISVIAFIAIVALAATAMLIARILLLIAFVLGGVYLLLLVVRNWLR